MWGQGSAALRNEARPPPLLGQLARLLHRFRLRSSFSKRLCANCLPEYDGQPLFSPSACDHHQGGGNVLMPCRVACWGPSSVRFIVWFGNLGRLYPLRLPSASFNRLVIAVWRTVGLQWSPLLHCCSLCVLPKALGHHHPGGRTPDLSHHVTPKQGKPACSPPKGAPSLTATSCCTPSCCFSTLGCSSLTEAGPGWHAA